MAYKVLFIDEEIEQQESFEEYFEESGKDIEIVSLLPLPSLEEMILKIDEEHPDAIVSDYQLNEIKTDIKYNVPYNGSIMVKEYRRRHANFPCFVLTSFDADAINQSDDVNLVYVKNVLHNGEAEAKAKFDDRVVEQISKYKKSIEEASEEMSILLQKRVDGTSTAAEEDKLIELDSFIERALDSESKIPHGLKGLSNQERLNSLIDKVNQLLIKLS